MSICNAIAVAASSPSSAACSSLLVPDSSATSTRKHSKRPIGVARIDCDACISSSIFGSHVRAVTLLNRRGTYKLTRGMCRQRFLLRASTEEASKQENVSEKKDNETSTGTSVEPSAETSNEDETKEDTTEPSTVEDEKVTFGSPLPGVKPSSQTARLPTEVVETLRNQVFGFDTFFVTGQEPYEGGVLFKGNLRGEAAKSYSKLQKRLEGVFGDKYKIFLLSNPEDGRPVCVVVPSESLEPLPPGNKAEMVVPEWIAAGAFGVVTVFTVLLRSSPALLLTNFQDSQLILDGVIAALPTLLVLFAHELGHRYVAEQIGAKLAVPYFIPSWQLGSFGAITRIVNVLQSRKDLLKVAVAGPLSGWALGLSIVLIGLLLPPAEGQGIVVNASAFHESFLVGGLAKLILGDALQEGKTLSINPVVLSGWVGLLINSINSIPIGELDGGRIVQALWGRKAWSRFTGVSIGLLGLAGIVNDVPLYVVVLVLLLQRGPISPQADEVTVPDGTSVALGVSVLLLGLLIYFPFPFYFSEVLPPLV